MLTIIMFIFIWYLFGIGSFIYWWTKDFDLTIEEIPIMIFAGILGPFAFLSGWEIHGRKKEKVLIKRRK